MGMGMGGGPGGRGIHARHVLLCLEDPPRQAGMFSVSTRVPFFGFTTLATHSRYPGQSFVLSHYLWKVSTNPSIGLTPGQINNWGAQTPNCQRRLRFAVPSETPSRVWGFWFFPPGTIRITNLHRQPGGLQQVHRPTPAPHAGGRRRRKVHPLGRGARPLFRRRICAEKGNAGRAV